MLIPTIDLVTISDIWSTTIQDRLVYHKSNICESGYNLPLSLYPTTKFVNDGLINKNDTFTWSELRRCRSDDVTRRLDRSDDVIRWFPPLADGRMCLDRSDDVISRLLRSDDVISGKCYKTFYSCKL